MNILASKITDKSNVSSTAFTAGNKGKPEIVLSAGDREIPLTKGQ